MNYKAVYFSATDTSKTGAVSIAKALAGGQGIEEINLTPFAAAGQAITLGADDFAVFSAPVYNGRIPLLTMQRFDKIKGSGSPCIVTVTYGNRDYDDALLELADWAAANGFKVQAAAALVGQHTFGEIQVGRPNADDVKENEKFVRDFLAAANGNLKRDNVTLAIKGERPYRSEGKGGDFRPLTAETCVHCGLCQRECPAGAIADDFKTLSESCISCFRCIKVCPVQAKNMDEPMYQEWAAGFTQRLAPRRENEYFLG